MDGREELPTRPVAASDLERRELSRNQQSYPRRQRRLYGERRWLPDADGKGPEGSRSEVFQVGPATASSEPLRSIRLPTSDRSMPPWTRNTDILGAALATVLQFRPALRPR